MRAEPDHLEFATFCRAVHDWLSTAPSLDPSLAAAADVLNLASDLDHLSADLVTATDTHRTLGASTVLALWDATRSGRLAPL